MINNLKEMQEIELSLLEKLKQICKKYKLTYYASCGTLLGTIRHKGFIPWDDDMDLFLMWPDYQKLMKVAPRECQYPFFFRVYIQKEMLWRTLVDCGGVTQQVLLDGNMRMLVVNITKEFLLISSHYFMCLILQKKELLKKNKLCMRGDAFTVTMLLFKRKGGDL